jgi:hypothetical protein
MASEPANQGGRILSAVLRFLKMFTLNSWRRLCILGRYSIICFHQQRLRRAWRLLGKHIHQTVEGGEVNPMLTEEVQDRLTRAEVIKETKDRHYQAIAALREKIRVTRTGEAPRPEETGPPDAEAAMGGAPRGPETG